MTSPDIIVYPRRRPPQTLIQKVGRWLEQGHLVVLPSETQYALSGDATAPEVIARARQTKGRDQVLPFSAFFSGREMLADWGIRIPTFALPLTQRFWPGPLTLVLPTRRAALRALGSEDSVGVRVSSEPLLMALTARYGKPLLATSANPSGVLFSLDQENEWLNSRVEGGETKWVRPFRYRRQPASTVLDCTGTRPRLLRTGAVSESDWRAVLRHS